MLMAFVSSGQTTLTFRFANPRIVHYTHTGSQGVPSDADYFEFDIQVKALAAGTYIFSGQAVLSFNNAAFSATAGNWLANPGPLLSGTFTQSGTKNKYDIVPTITGSPFVINIAWSASNLSTFQTDYTRFNEITTSYQTLVIVAAPITDPTVTAGASINFVQGSMNNQQSYKLLASPWYAKQNDPNAYDPATFTNTYLGRIYSDTKGWSQVGGTTDNVQYTNWTTAVNTSVWDGAATIPTGASNVASAVRIHSGATLTIPSTGALTATNLENNTASGLTIQSTSGSATGSLVTTGTVSGAGTAVVQRWMTGDIWHLVSPPVTGEAISAFTAASGNSVGYKSSNSHYALAPYAVSTDVWSYYGYPSPSGTFDTPGKGYQILRGSASPTGNGNAVYDGTVTFTGNLAAADVTSPVSSGGYSWNLIGNPYPCGLNIADFITANTSLIDGSYHFIYVSKVGDTSTYGYDPETSRTVIPPGEGFFIKSTANSTVSFTTSMKRASSDAFKSAALNYPTINLSAETSTDKMNTTVNYISGMSNGLDPGYDAGLFNGGGLGSFSLSTRLVQDNGVDFQIQCLPDNDYENTIVPVGLVAASGSAITFKAAVTNLPSDLKVVLEDRVTNTFTRLDGGGSYSVTLNAASAGPGRFFLRTATIVSAVPGDLTVELKVVALPNQQIIQVFGNVNLPARALVYDMNGKLFTSKVLTGADPNEIPLVNAVNGIYLLKIESNKTPLTQKIRWIRD